MSDVNFLRKETGRIGLQLLNAGMRDGRLASAIATELATWRFLGDALRESSDDEKVRQVIDEIRTIKSV